MKETQENSFFIFSRLKNYYKADRNVFFAAAGLLVAVYLLSALFSENFIGGTGLRLADYEAGRVADRDIVVDRDIQYTDTIATEMKREAEALLVYPVFSVKENITSRIVENYQDFVETYKNLISDSARSSSEIFLEIQSAFPGYLEKEEFENIDGLGRRVQVAEEAGRILSEMMQEGIVSYPENFRNSTETIELMRWKGAEKQREEISQSEVYQLSTVEQNAAALVDEDEYSREEAAAIAALVSAFAEENAFYDSSQTDKERQRARESVEPVVKKMVEDEVIVKKGFIVTREDMVKVEALGDYSGKLYLSGFFGRLLLLVFIFLVSVRLLSPPVLDHSPETSLIYLLIVLYFLFFASVVIVSRYANVPDGIPEAVFFPAALFTMLISILVSVRVGIMSTVIMSLTIFILPGDQVWNFLFCFISGVFGSLIVYGACNRITLIKAGLFISLVNVMIIIASGLIRNMELQQYLNAVVLAAVNGFMCGVLTIGFLPILEHILNAPTQFRLMELSDLNTPMFKRMLILAPGTYSHSISVANLAETAAKDIGANALLARVGAYYHDIGKIDQAEYFIENQTEGNKHDDMKASLSTAVIKSHVKIGYEKGKELGLPKEVIQIISQHHGSGQISYFYMKALKEQKMDQKLSPEDFSYNGTPPVSREAAVVMLADTVEAATRTLKNPTMAKLERFVWDLIMEKVSSGQMKNSGLTFNNLETIKNTFVQLLGASYHKRIEYPGQKESNDEQD